MDPSTVKVHEGLEGVVATATRLSHVDGEHGRLIVAGQDVEALAARADFETACALLWTAAGDTTTPDEARDQLAAARARAFARLPALGDALHRDDAMDALRASVSHLPSESTAA